MGHNGEQTSFDLEVLLIFIYSSPLTSWCNYNLYYHKERLFIALKIYIPSTCASNNSQLNRKLKQF